jgi:hypothetical protein
MAFLSLITRTLRTSYVEAFDIDFAKAARVSRNIARFIDVKPRKQTEALLFFSEYLHEKAEESRHNETIGYMIIIFGSLFFVGGLLETIITAELGGVNPDWFLTFPYHFTPIRTASWAHL